MSLGFFIVVLTEYGVVVIIRNAKMWIDLLAVCQALYNIGGERGYGFNTGF